jgi:hypothetical protein
MSFRTQPNFVFVPRRIRGNTVAVIYPLDNINKEFTSKTILNEYLYYIILYLKCGGDGRSLFKESIA